MLDAIKKMDGKTLAIGAGGLVAVGILLYAMRRGSASADEGDGVTTGGVLPYTLPISPGASGQDVDLGTGTGGASSGEYTTAQELENLTNLAQIQAMQHYNDNAIGALLTLPESLANAGIQDFNYVMSVIGGTTSVSFASRLRPVAVPNVVSPDPTPTSPNLPPPPAPYVDPSPPPGSQGNLAGDVVLPNFQHPQSWNAFEYAVGTGSYNPNESIESMILRYSQSITG